MAKGRPRPTRCFQTGELFPSLGAALREKGLSPGLWRHAFIGCPVGPDGLLFDPIEPDDPDWMRVPSRRLRESSALARPVRCIETGQVYPSAAAAARSLYLSRNCIYQAINKSYRAGGYRWEWVA